MKRILIITREQFGYLTDTYNYCLYLKNNIDITYICFNENRPKITCEGINVIYVERDGGVNKSCLKLLKFITQNIKEIKYDTVFCVFFRYCFLLPILNKNTKFIMDIRTGNVNHNKFKNIIGNLEIKFSSIFFNKVTIISKSLAKKLNIYKYELLPLGAKNLVKEKRKLDSKINLIYVGTLNNRNIDETIHGYYKYLNLKTSSIDTKYTIVGDGDKVVEDKINATIRMYGLEDKVTMVGRIKNDELGKFFNNHNIGVSYIPMEDYYDIQPPTKTYEYIINGLICIATKTQENSKIINTVNGVLCEDNPESFAEALSYIEKNIYLYDPINIRETVDSNSWENISKNIFMSIILRSM